MPVSDQLIDNNRTYVRAESWGDPTVPATTHVAVVTCMDARIDPVSMLGLRPGDAHILRNAGGLVTDDVIRSLVVSQQVVGTDGILLIQHTNCGLEGADAEAIRAALAADLGLGPEPPTFDVGTFADADVLVRSQLLRLRTHPWLRRVPVHAMRFDVETGILDVIE